MLQTYAAVCADVQEYRLTVEGAKERARTLSLALSPTPAEVVDTRASTVLCFFADGTEYPTSLLGLAYEHDPNTLGHDIDAILGRGVG